MFLTSNARRLNLLEFVGPGCMVQGGLRIRISIDGEIAFEVEIGSVQAAATPNGSLDLKEEV